MNLAPVFQLWKETRVPGETPHKHEENRQTPHRKPKAGLQPSNVTSVSHTVNLMYVDQSLYIFSNLSR